MNRFIRFFNQNRIRIIVTILIVVFIILIIQAINYILKQAEPEAAPTEPEIVDTSRPSESVISGEELPEETTDTNLNVISQFVEYCNNKQYQNAYDLLTQDCKDELFGTLDLFVSNYCNQIFTSTMTYQLELWYAASSTYTYRITYFTNNLLATGSATPTNTKEDYITIKTSRDGDKLNINNFIEKDEINNSQTAEDTAITIAVNDRYIYRDYEIYNITISNNTDKTILISNGVNSNDICLVDTNEVEYNSILNEVPLVNLELEPGISKTIEIRFNKMYNIYRTIDHMSFKNIILDKQAYEQNAESAATISINIDI